MSNNKPLLDYSGIGCGTVIIGGTLSIVIVLIIMFIYNHNFNKKYASKVDLPVVVKEEMFTYNDVDPSSTMKCSHYSKLIDGHDYLVIYAFNGSPLSGQLLHDPECKKCREFTISEWIVDDTNN